MDKASKHIIEILHKHGFDAMWVGGCVRDTILGLVPNDFDVATNARLDSLKDIFKTGKVVGESFGIMLVDDIEIAPFRVDLSCDGRHATVEFVDTIEEDLARRDLTINAMAMKLDGTIIDPFGGQDDLRDGVVRFVGNPIDRLEEDFLRALRAVRFAQRFDFEIEAESLKAIQGIADKVPSEISPERIVMELEKMV
jgi:tRNA nucleotidyltransferase (CCA-adding enzyme)